MPLGSVLVIEDDGWVSSLLSTAIREAGYDVVVCSFAQEGLDRACAEQPDCIICDVDLPDHDGYWVARNVRTHPSRVSVTPFLFLSGLDDEKSRLEGFHVGADVYMTKPFRVDEVVAQIGALVQMAARLRVRRDSMISIAPASVANAIEGDLGQMSIATVLTVLEMERRTGVFEVVSKKRRAHVEMVRGGVIDGMVGGTRVSALTALRSMLTWNVGRFSFKPGPVRDVPQSQKSLGAFLIEALRLEDEAARDELELPASKRRSSEHRLAPPALGGPASTTADFAPPSSRTPGFVRTPAANASSRHAVPAGNASSPRAGLAASHASAPRAPTPVAAATTPRAPGVTTTTAAAAPPPRAPFPTGAATPPRVPVPTGAATPPRHPPSSGSTREAMLPVEPDLADWEIPEAMTPRTVTGTPLLPKPPPLTLPLPKPPPLTVPRLTALHPPTSPFARKESETPIPATPAMPRLGVPLPPRPGPRTDKKE